MQHKEPSGTLHPFSARQGMSGSLQRLRELKPSESRPLVGNLDVFVDVDLAFFVLSRNHDCSDAADGHRREDQLSHLKNSGRHDILPCLLRGASCCAFAALTNDGEVKYPRKVRGDTLDELEGHEAGSVFRRSLVTFP